jgi:hypothetical protein
MTAWAVTAWAKLDWASKAAAGKSSSFETFSKFIWFPPGKI